MQTSSRRSVLQRGAAFTTVIGLIALVGAVVAIMQAQLVPKIAEQQRLAMESQLATSHTGASATADASSGEASLGTGGEVRRCISNEGYRVETKNGDARLVRTDKKIRCDLWPCSHADPGQCSYHTEKQCGPNAGDGVKRFDCTVEICNPAIGGQDVCIITVEPDQGVSEQVDTKINDQATKVDKANSELGASKDRLEKLLQAENPDSAAVRSALADVKEKQAAASAASGSLDAINEAFGQGDPAARIERKQADLNALAKLEELAANPDALINNDADKKELFSLIDKSTTATEELVKEAERVGADIVPGETRITDTAERETDGTPAREVPGTGSTSTFSPDNLPEQKPNPETAKDRYQKTQSDLEDNCHLLVGCTGSDKSTGELYRERAAAIADMSTEDLQTELARLEKATSPEECDLLTCRILSVRGEYREQQAAEEQIRAELARRDTATAGETGPNRGPGANTTPDPYLDSPERRGLSTPLGDPATAPSGADETRTDGPGQQDPPDETRTDPPPRTNPPDNGAVRQLQQRLAAMQRAMQQQAAKFQQALQRAQQQAAQQARQAQQAAQRAQQQARRQQQQNACSKYPGTRLSGGSCKCPSGQSWSGSKCERANACSKYPGATLVNGQCQCPQTQKWNGQRCIDENRNPNAQLAADLSCAPLVQEVGAPVAISFACRGAQTASAQGFETGNELSGSANPNLSVPSNATSRTYTLVCRSSNGQEKRDQCTVNATKAILVTATNPNPVESGKTARIGWITKGMRTCSIQATNSSQAQASEFNSQYQNKNDTNGVATTPTLTEQLDVRIRCTTDAGTSKTADVEVGVSSQASS